MGTLVDRPYAAEGPPPFRARSRRAGTGLVATVYADTSVLVKLYDSREPRAADVRQRLLHARVASSVLVRAEILSAVARKLRAGELAAEETLALRRRIQRDYRRILKVRLTNAVLDETERLLFECSLRASDAIHLGSAALLSRRLGFPLPVLTADEPMWRAASAAEMPAEYFGA
ncbi:MAG: type II toxin-antitoxin system VapC family toxin [Candidatus Binatia bacterium]